MKKVLLLLVGSLMISGAAYSQFALGVKLGYNANKLSTNIDTVKSQFNSGFHVGVWTHIGKRFYFAPELVYSLSGAVFSEEGSLTVNKWKQKVTIGSLDIPLLLGFKLIHSDVLTWRIELGPEASFTINENISDKEGAGPLTTGDFSNVNWYVEGGTGIDVLFLAFNIRYKYGLNKMITDVQNWQFDSHNGMFLVSVGFKILGKK